MTVDYGVSGLGPRKRDRWPAPVPRAAEKLRHLAAAHGALPGVNSPSQPLLCSAVPCMCASVPFLGLLRPFPRGSSPCSPLSVSVRSVPLPSCLHQAWEVLGSGAAHYTLPHSPVRCLGHNGPCRAGGGSSSMWEEGQPHVPKDAMACVWP